MFVIIAFSMILNILFQRSVVLIFPRDAIIIVSIVKVKTYYGTLFTQTPEIKSIPSSFYLITLKFITCRTPSMMTIIMRTFK